jgi:hypothetical protein
MTNSSIRFTSFPRIQSSPFFVRSIVDVFKVHEQEISTIALKKGLESNQVLAILRDDLQTLSFEVETGKTSSQKIHRPVLYGENEEPILRYEIDAYNAEWKCGLVVSHDDMDG